MTVQPGMRASVGRDDLEHDLRQPGRLDQVIDLLPHHPGPADRAGQHPLVDDHPQQRRIVLGEDGLPVHPGADQPADLVVTAGRVGRLQNGPRVLLGLQQPGDEQRLEPAQRGRFPLDLDPVAEPRRVRLAAHQRLQAAEQAAGAQRIVGPAREIDAGRPAAGFHVRHQRRAVGDLLR
jgi:hypothetical protein